MAVKSSPSEPVLANLDGLLPELEAIYRDIHSHPELSMLEERTAGTWNHGLRWDIPAQVHASAEGDFIGKSGTNDFGKRAYGGPCPPRGIAHRYFFRLFALGVAALDIAPGARRAALEKALKPHAVAQVEYAGRYARGS